MPFNTFQSMDNLSIEDKRFPAHERIALALKHAGVSITVTSITNMFAFLIGATSVSVQIKSFSLYDCVYKKIFLIYDLDNNANFTPLPFYISFISEHANCQIFLYLLWNGNLLPLFLLRNIFCCVSTV